MAVTVARLEAVLSAQTRDFDRAMTSSQTRMQRVGAAGKVMGGILAGAVAAGLVKSVREAVEAEKAQTRLEQAFKGAKLSIDPYREAIERASTAAINLGFDDEALKNSIGSLIIATGDYKEAQSAATVAMDLARFRGIELEGATRMLTMAMGGSQRATKALGLSVQPVTAEYDRLKREFGAHLSPAERVALAQAKINDKNATAALVIDTVRQKVRGQAQAYSETAAGSMEVFRAKTEELQEKLGTKLLPRLTEVVTFLSRMVDKLEKVDEWMGKVGANKGLIELIGDAWKSVAGWINAADKQLKSFFDRLDISGPSGIDVIKGLFGDADPNKFKMQIPSGAGGLVPGIMDELAGAQRMGLVLTSGVRPGAVTKHGTPSDHATGKAIDVAGAPANMARFFRWLIGQTDVKQAFYDPLGSIFGGALSSYREGGHSDHVHVATYDRGGWLMPGLTLAANNTGRPEYVGAPMGDINLYVDGQKLFSWFRNAEQKHQRRSG